MKITFQSPMWFWRSVFVALLIGVLAFFTIASEQLNYHWNWRQVPKFFLSHEKNTIVSPVEGVITAITPQGKLNKITIHPFFGDDLIVDVSDAYTNVHLSEHVYEGDAVGYEVKWQHGPLLIGLGTTIWLSLLSGLIGIVIGTITALMRLSKNLCLQWIATWYIEIIRGTPLLVQLMIAYFFIGTLLNLDRNMAGLGALALFSGAYFAEIIRAGLVSISTGITEAAYSLGLSYWQTMRFVVLPIAFKRTLPSLTGQWISLIKDSSLVSVIAMTDLTKAARDIAASTFASFEVWFSVALVYLLLTLTLSKIIHRLEKRVQFND